MEVEDHPAEAEQHGELEREGEDGGDALTEHQLPGFEVTGPQAFPRRPRVFAKHRESEVPNEETTEEHRAAGDDLCGAVHGLVRIADAHRGTERAFGEGHEPEGHDREDDDEHRVAPKDPQVVPRDGQDAVQT
jgi:hypothetical protein